MAAVSAIILAAGQAKRMGQLKQLMPLGESTILEQTIDNLIGSSVSEVIVVLGHRASEVMRRISGRPIKIVVNPLHRQGMGSSIAAGLKFVDRQAEAVILALGDQPYVDSATVNRLLQAFEKGDKGIAIPTFRGKRGHPPIFSLNYREHLSKIKGDIGGREIIKQHPDDVLEVAVKCQGVITDIDTPGILP